MNTNINFIQSNYCKTSSRQAREYSTRSVSLLVIPSNVKGCLLFLILVICDTIMLWFIDKNGYTLENVLVVVYALSLIKYFYQHLKRLFSRRNNFSLDKKEKV